MNPIYHKVVVSAMHHLLPVTTIEIFHSSLESALEIAAQCFNLNGQHYEKLEISGVVVQPKIDTELYLYQSPTVIKMGDHFLQATENETRHETLDYKTAIEHVLDNQQAECTHADIVGLVIGVYMQNIDESYLRGIKQRVSTALQELARMEIIKKRKMGNRKYAYSLARWYDSATGELMKKYQS